MYAIIIMQILDIFILESYTSAGVVEQTTYPETFHFVG